MSEASPDLFLRPVRVPREDTCTVLGKKDVPEKVWIFWFKYSSNLHSYFGKWDSIYPDLFVRNARSYSSPSCHVAYSNVPTAQPLNLSRVHLTVKYGCSNEGRIPLRFSISKLFSNRLTTWKFSGKRNRLQTASL